MPISFRNGVIDISGRTPSGVAYRQRFRTPTAGPTSAPQPQPTAPPPTSPVPPDPPLIPAPVQPTIPTTCTFSQYGFSMSETPISIYGSIMDHFNGIWAPPHRLVDTEPIYREEAARRLTAVLGNNHMFVNTGYKLNNKCLLDIYRGELVIPNTQTIIFQNWFFPQYNERLYVGSDLFLYRLEIQGTTGPNDPPRNDPNIPGGGSTGGGIPIEPPIPPPPLPQPPPGMSFGSGKYLNKLAPGDILMNDAHIKTYGMWSNNVGNLLAFHTSSLTQQGTGSRKYNLEIRDYAATDCRSRVQFHIAYGHSGGSGSKDTGGLDWVTPTNAVYKQYAQLCLEASQSKFRMTGSTVDSIYAINVRKSLMGDRLDEGNWELNLHHLSGSGYTGAVSSWTGSTVVVSDNDGEITRLIDDSSINRPMIGSAGEIYQVVSGSIEQGVYSPTSPQVYGLFYPRLGTIVLNGHRLDSDLGFLTVTGSDQDGQNTEKLWKSISGSALYTDASGDSLGFSARRMSKIYTRQYFIRIKNLEFNFTNNPTFISGSDGIIVSDFVNTPRTYVTSIGLYNARRELLAVAKLSKPIEKNFTEENLLKVVLKYE